MANADLPIAAELWERLFEDEASKDVEVVSKDGDTFKVHRVILRCCSYAANDQAQALWGPIPMLGPDAELAPAHGEAGPAALRGCEARICVHILPKNAAATLHVPDETLPDSFLNILPEDVLGLPNVIASPAVICAQMFPHSPLLEECGSVDRVDASLPVYSCCLGTLPHPPSSLPLR